MRFPRFIGEVQNRAELATELAAVIATRATLETLGERLNGEVEHLAAQLPIEIGRFLGPEGKGEQFSLNEFFERVSLRADADRPAAEAHARAVVEVLQEAVSPAEIRVTRSALPEEYAPLFERRADSGTDDPSIHEELAGVERTAAL